MTKYWDKHRLEIILIKKGIQQNELQKLLDIKTRFTIRKKIDKCEFSLMEIHKICKTYSLKCTITQNGIFFQEIQK